MNERLAYIGGKLFSSIMVCLKDELHRKLVVKMKCEVSVGEKTRTLFSKEFEICELNP